MANACARRLYGGGITSSGKFGRWPVKTRHRSGFGYFKQNGLQPAAPFRCLLWYLFKTGTPVLRRLQLRRILLQINFPLVSIVTRTLMKNMLLWAGLATVLMCALLLWIDRIATEKLEALSSPGQGNPPRQVLKTMPATVAPLPAVQDTTRKTPIRRCGA